MSLETSTANTIDRAVLSEPRVSAHASDGPLTVGIPEACRMLGIGRTKLHEMMTAGEVRALRIGGRTLIEVASLRAVVANAPAWKATA